MTSRRAWHAVKNAAVRYYAHAAERDAARAARYDEDSWEHDAWHRSSIRMTLRAMRWARHLDLDPCVFPDPENIGEHRADEFLYGVEIELTECAVCGASIPARGNAREGGVLCSACEE